MRVMRCLLLLLMMVAGQLFAQTQQKQVGEHIYQYACQTCHAPNKAEFLRAPAAFDSKAWAPIVTRAKAAMAKAPKKYASPYDYLLQQVKWGKGMMRHGGLCFENVKTNKDCSDQALIAAIKYMSQTKQN